MEQKQRAPFLLVALADLRRGGAEAVERSKEATVGLMSPTHVARAAPAGRAQTIQPSVIPHTMGCIPLDRVASEPPDLRPPVEETRPPSDNTSDRGAARVDVGHVQRRGEPSERVLRFRVDHRFWQSGGQRDGSIGHGRIVPRDLAPNAPIAKHEDVQMSEQRTFDVDFYFDPVCPWAWLTSRWVAEVERLKGLRVNWTFIALRILNEHRDYGTEFPDGYPAVHGRGLRLLRVAAATRQQFGADPVGGLYTAFGTRIHVERNGESLDSVETIADLLAALGLPRHLAGAADDASFDDELRASTNEALERTGRDVGTPILTFGPPDGPSIFGPVISQAPKGQAAVDLWEHVTALSADPNFAELKRQIRRRPVFD